MNKSSKYDLTFPAYAYSRFLRKNSASHPTRWWNYANQTRSTTLQLRAIIFLPRDVSSLNIRGRPWFNFGFPPLRKMSYSYQRAHTKAIKACHRGRELRRIWATSHGINITKNNLEFIVTRCRTSSLKWVMHCKTFPLSRVRVNHLGKTSLLLNSILNCRPSQNAWLLDVALASYRIGKFLNGQAQKSVVFPSICCLHVRFKDR